MYHSYSPFRGIAFVIPINDSDWKGNRKWWTSNINNNLLIHIKNNILSHKKKNILIILNSFKIMNSLHLSLAFYLQEWSDSNQIP